MPVIVVVDRFKDLIAMLTNMAKRPSTEGMRLHVEAAGKIGRDALRGNAPRGRLDIPGKSRDDPDHVPLRTGIDYRVTQRDKGFDLTFYGPPHLEWQTKGTQKHNYEIGPRNAPRIVFFWVREDRWWVGNPQRPYVNHPGIQASRWHEQALQNVRTQFLGELRKGGVYAATKAMRDFFE